MHGLTQIFLYEVGLLSCNLPASLMDLFLRRNPIVDLLMRSNLLMDLFVFMNTNLLVDSTRVLVIESNHALLNEKESSYLLSFQKESNCGLLNEKELMSSLPSPHVHLC
jgi:hypothetical protein